MTLDFITLQLLSESFREKLLWLKDNDTDTIATYLLIADNTINGYRNIPEELPENIYKTFIDTINSQVTDTSRQLTLKKDAFEVSFLPKGCTPEYSHSGTWKTKNRQSGKPGRIIQKLIGPGKFSNSEYEKFVYRLTALWSTGGYTLKIVSGEDIRYWYNCENYYEQKSTLGHSCMGDSNCSDYLDLYVEQPQCQMLIALKDDKLAARALVWTVENPESPKETITFLDRVYYIEDALYNIFLNYAKEKKWIVRNSNELLSDGDNQHFLGPADTYLKPFTGNYSFKIKRSYKYYPYIDSFRYLDVDKMYLSTSYNKSGYRCSYTDGSLVELELSCDNCGDYICCEDDGLWSEYYQEFGCENCMQYSPIMEDYIFNTDAVLVRSNTDILCVAASDWLEGSDEYLRIGDNWIHKDNPRVIEKDGKYELKPTEQD